MTKRVKQRENDDGSLLTHRIETAEEKKVFFYFYFFLSLFFSKKHDIKSCFVVAIILFILECRIKVILLVFYSSCTFFCFVF